MHLIFLVINEKSAIFELSTADIEDFSLTACFWTPVGNPVGAMIVRKGSKFQNVYTKNTRLFTLVNNHLGVNIAI